VVHRFFVRKRAIRNLEPFRDSDKAGTALEALLKLTRENRLLIIQGAVLFLGFVLLLIRVVSLFVCGLIAFFRRAKNGVERLIGEGLFNRWLAFFIACSGVAGGVIVI